jgi:hypothetical protein
MCGVDSLRARTTRFVQLHVAVFPTLLNAYAVTIAVEANVECVSAARVRSWPGLALVPRAGLAHGGRKATLEVSATRQASVGKLPLLACSGVAQIARFRGPQVTRFGADHLDDDTFRSPT